jgi:hypothetical protein
MNLGHFQYLLAGQPAQVKHAADQLDLLAKTAAKRYIDEGVPLNETISKLAQQNDLNPNQIDRVCEMANIETHKALWSKTAQKETISFPLAKAAQVKQMNGDPGEVKTAAPIDMSADYLGPPKGLPSHGDLNTLMGIDKTAGHNGLEGASPKQRIIATLQKKAAERERVADKICYQGMELETLEKEAWGHVKQTVIGGTSFQQVYDAAAAAGLAKVAGEYLPKFHERLITETYGAQRNRLEKMAIAPVDPDLISENLGNMTIVNGAHPVLVSLDTIQKKTGEIKQGLINLISIDDDLKIFGQKLRELQ